MTEQDALAEAKNFYEQASNLPETTNATCVMERLMFAQTAALIAIAEALTEKKDVK